MTIANNASSEQSLQGCVFSGSTSIQASIPIGNHQNLPKDKSGTRTQGHSLQYEVQNYISTTIESVLRTIASYRFDTASNNFYSNQSLSLRGFPGQSGIIGSGNHIGREEQYNSVCLQCDLAILHAIYIEDTELRDAVLYLLCVKARELGLISGFLSQDILYVWFLPRLRQYAKDGKVSLSYLTPGATRSHACNKLFNASADTRLWPLLRMYRKLSNKSQADFSFMAHQFVTIVRAQYSEIPPRLGR